MQLVEHAVSMATAELEIKLMNLLIYIVILNPDLYHRLFFFFFDPR